VPCRIWARICVVVLLCALVATRWPLLALPAPKESAAGPAEGHIALARTDCPPRRTFLARAHFLPTKPNTTASRAPRDPIHPPSTHQASALPWPSSHPHHHLTSPSSPPPFLLTSPHRTSPPSLTSRSQDRNIDVVRLACTPCCELSLLRTRRPPEASG